jgi:hypothetical protein
VDAIEVESFVGNWGFEVSGTFGSSLGALWELSGSSLGALWELVTVASIFFLADLHNSIKSFDSALDQFNAKRLQRGGG